MSKRAGIWIRVSTEDQALGDSPKMHEHRARSYIQSKGWNEIEVYHLEGVSGKSVMGHPEAQRMIDDVKRGHIDSLVFSKLARLGRSTRELLEIADIFREYKADLISLGESIDTSTPSGRMFFTIMSSVAEFEREETASRIKASISVRAKEGKPLGGETPFGYVYINKVLELHPKEAPIRKLIHEEFAKHKRKRTVARILNEQGYRTRRGEPFSDTSIDRMLRDPIVKGLRRVNYTESQGNRKGWNLKPQEEWTFVASPRLISDELWDTCNKILDDMGKDRKVGRVGVHPFSGVLRCSCGEKMYVRTNSPKYVCNSCKNKISPEDLEEIFKQKLENFLKSDIELHGHLESEKKIVEEKNKLLDSQRKELQKVKQKVSSVIELYNIGELTKETFREHYAPEFEKQQQIEQSILELQQYIDTSSMESLGNEQVLSDAQNLFTLWDDFTKEEKKIIIETITESIVIGKEDIEIKLSYIPTLAQGQEPKVHTANLNIYNPYYSKSVQISDKPSWIHRGYQHKATRVLYGRFCS